MYDSNTNHIIHYSLFIIHFSAFANAEKGVGLM